MRIAIPTLVTSVAIASVAATPALAADLGTYRPGTPYHSIIVPTANVCESQCAGDARCRGWNYVKAAPDAAGVCEFQSQVSQPISSAISISGVNASATLVSNRIVVGNTNTIRVGAPVSERTSNGHRMVREPVPETLPQRFQPALDSYNPAHTVGEQRTMARTPTTQSVVARGPARQSPLVRQPRADGHATSQTQQMGSSSYGKAQSVYQGQPYTQPHAQFPTQNQGRPAIGQTIAAPSQRPITQPASTQVQPYNQASSAQPMPRASVTNPVTWTTPQQNLYGNLYDDVRIPAANSPIPLDPNAPIPTATARPTAPIGQGQLAGARRR